MFGRVFRTAFDLITGFLVLLTVAVALLGWRLSAGPISLDFMTPLIANALSGADGASIVDIEATELAWGARKTFDIRVRGVRVLGPDGKLTLEAPQIAVSLSARALILHGLIAPTTLEISGVQVTLTRSAEGELKFRSSADAPDASSALAGLLGGLLAPPDPERSLGYLESARVLDTAVAVIDDATGRVWLARDAVIEVFRDEGGIRAEMAATAEIGGKPAAIAASGAYQVSPRSAALTIGLADVDPAQLAALDPVLAPLAGLSMPLSGRVAVKFDQTFKPTGADFEFSGRDGRLAASVFNLPQDADLRRFSVRGQVTDGLRAAEINEAVVDLGGPTITLDARVTALDTERPQAEGGVVIRNVPVNDLRRLWPMGAAENARRWIIDNLSNGTVSETTVEFAAARDPAIRAGWKVDRLAGALQFTKIDVNYLTPMPRVRGIDGRATFNARRFEITGQGGTVGDLRQAGATVILDKLDTDNETAAIAVDIEGPVRAALELVDGEPLGFLRKLDQHPADFSGSQTTHVTVDLPLKRSLLLDEVKVGATATLKDFGQRAGVMGLDLTGGEATLRVDANGMDITGRVQVGGIPADVQVRRNFAANAPFAAWTHARATVEAANSPMFGLSLAPYVDGPLDLVVDYLERRRDGDLTLDIGLDRAKLAVDEFEWAKPAGVKADAKVRLAIADGRLTAIPDFAVNVDGKPAARGRLEFAGDGRTVSRAEIASLKLGLNDARLVYVQNPNARTIEIAGASFNAGPSMRDKTPPAPDRPALDLRVDVDNLYLAEDRQLRQVSFRGRRSSTRWETMTLSASTAADMGPRSGVSLDLTNNNGMQTLELRAEDGGAFLRALDITPSIVGGALQASARTDDKRAGQPLVGKLHMDAFRAVKAPVLARVVGVALLTGIVDALSGPGVGFSGIDAEFAYYGSKLEVLEGAAAGSSLGVTAKGVIDLDADMLDLDGTLVPANLLNSLPARIPLIGPIITGGGGGLFATSYRITGPMDDPKVTTSTLSTFAPGPFRKLFELFSGSAPTLEPAPPPEPAPQRSD